MAEHLVVLHSHFRPGGVRRVVEIALPAIAREMGLRAVTLAAGEEAPARWLDALARRMRGVELRPFIEPAFRYVSEQRAAPATLRRRLEAAVRRLPGDALWFHNPSLARNVPLVEAVNAELRRRAMPAVYHHHDLWVDNRWARWPELRALGYRTLDHVARRVFPPHVSHAAINRLDHAILAKGFPAASWMPNPAPRGTPPSARAVRAARRWLRDRVGNAAPVWIFPTRFLRRKNLAEAVLLTRWLRPEATFVTTAGVSSREEWRYANCLREAARRGGWRARFGILADAADGAPDVEALIAASEVVLLTSVQEGFGLPYIEAAAAGKPLIARGLPNVSPDLERLGFRLPGLYDEAWIAPGLLDLAAERRRQRAIWKTWRASLPVGVRKLAPPPEILSGSPERIAFSRLTLAAQLEVLAAPPGGTWRACAPLNPALARASARRVAVWPAPADRALGAERYAAGLRAALERAPVGETAEAGPGVQRAFVEQRLGRDFIFPILTE